MCLALNLSIFAYLASSEAKNEDEDEASLSLKFQVPKDYSCQFHEEYRYAGRSVQLELDAELCKSENAASVYKTFDLADYNLGSKVDSWACGAGVNINFHDDLMS